MTQLQHFESSNSTDVRKVGWWILSERGNVSWACDLYCHNCFQLQAMCRDSQLVAGAGATEIELAKQLKEYGARETGYDCFISITSSSFFGRKFSVPLDKPVPLLKGCCGYIFLTISTTTSRSNCVRI